MSINKVILVGNVGKDPEVRYFDNGGSVANFSLATTEKGYTAANGTQVPDRTEWHNVVLWRGLAEIAEKYVRKGSKLYVEGKIRTRSYDDASGNKRYVTEIWGDNIELLDKKPTDSFPPPPPLTSEPQVASRPSQPPVVETVTPVGSFEEKVSGDDDLPF
ncbi:MAG: single-stranded DNA-binding protein [Dysgonamonadaceae bacterium]|jgi:single-strand DNA-binding protein|nr:single-stranded DNA-binding protein [Dysgonamonadaceae bacterium]